MHHNKTNKKIMLRGYKKIFMLNLAEHEISNTHKYKNIKKFSFCQAYNAIFPTHKC